MVDFIKSKLGALGGLLAFLGIGSSLLAIFDYNLRALMWIDLWGTTMGWVLRIGFIVVGAALFFLMGGMAGDDDE